ncbi:rhodanese-like domain-containing protein [Staphylospora marina]|uniref:rhodanese-like domain-containing protein n=1 Tax=Staphylospora marina TaxID=2490858 RepID=UPI000F5C0AEF|nr:rhodanese-like domain-containing protein [Staphylospora marina]
MTEGVLFHISPEEFAEMIRKGGIDGQVVDVREEWEWEEVRLEGAVLIPLGKLPAKIGEIDPAQKVYLLCAHGIRSLHAARFLLNHGFRNVVNVDGGVAAVLTEWKRREERS